MFLFLSLWSIYVTLAQDISRLEAQYLGRKQNKTNDINISVLQAVVRFPKKGPDFEVRLVLKYYQRYGCYYSKCDIFLTFYGGASGRKSG